jgi:phosphoglycerate dehydrogenase-like enzyme
LATEVLVTISFSEGLAAQLRGVSPKLRVTVQGAASADEIAPEIWARTEILYTGRILPAPERVPNLKWIQSHFAGIDGLLREPIFAKANLIVTTLSGVAVSQMAEYAVMMVLALGHRLPAMNASQRKADWPKDRWERFAPLELRNATVGLVGYGSIARQIARLLQPFGATVLACKRDAMTPRDNGYTAEDMGDPDGNFVHRLYPSQALRSMVRECDFVIVTTPLTANTRGLINAEVLSAMKPTAFIVDVARGGIIDHVALTKALQDNKLAGAALDVFPEEPLPASSPLWQMPNVIITPHISGNSPRYDERAVTLFSENLTRYLAGLPLYNVFNFERGY